MSQFGVSILNNNNFDNQFGLSIVSQNNVYVIIEDSDGIEVVASLTVSGGSDIDGSYNSYSNYSFTSGSYTSITFEASATGYVTDSITEDISENGYTVITIVLEADVVTFSCETYPVTTDGVQISSPVQNSKIRVVFTGNINFDPNDYSFNYFAYVPGTAKTGMNELDGEVIATTSNSITIDFDVLGSGESYCYIPNITLKQCP